MTFGQTWWSIPVILALRRPRQLDHKFQASVGYRARLHMCMYVSTQMQGRNFIGLKIDQTLPVAP